METITLNNGVDMPALGLGVFQTPPRRTVAREHRRMAGANDAGGANVNRLMSSTREDLDKLAGMALLTGVPVRVDLASITSAVRLRH
jgi:hypothetical protein